MEKTEWATTCITFLGILVNGKTHSLSIPHEKVTKALNLIRWAIAKKKVTIKFIQRLTGTLNFLNKAIVPGRPFTKGMYNKLKLKDNQGNLLKQFHHINLEQDFINNCMMWEVFLTSADCVQLCRPFIDVYEFAEAKTLNFYTDTSLNKFLGMGGIFGNRWIVGTWGPQFIET